MTADPGGVCLVFTDSSYMFHVFQDYLYINVAIFLNIISNLFLLSFKFPLWLPAMDGLNKHSHNEVNQLPLPSFFF